MAKTLPDIIENPMVIERPYRSPDPVFPMVKPDPVCCCGCGKVIVDGYKGSGEWFYSKECIAKVAIEAWDLKEVG